MGFGSSPDEFRTKEDMSEILPLLKPAVNPQPRTAKMNRLIIPNCRFVLGGQLIGIAVTHTEMIYIYTYIYIAYVRMANPC